MIRVREALGGNGWVLLPLPLPRAGQRRVFGTTPWECVEPASCSEGEQSRRDLGRLKLKGYVRAEGAVLLFDSAALVVGGCSPPINNDILRLTILD